MNSRGFMLAGFFGIYQAERLTIVADIYNADPFGNRAFYEKLFGEETVDQMTNATGENTANENARALFPRVNFREVEDAEMVVAVLRNASIDMVKRVAQAVQLVRVSKAIDQLGVVEAVLTDQHGKKTSGYPVIKEMTDAIGQMVGMVEAVTSQLAVMYGTPDEGNAKYISDLLEFVRETREVLADIIGTNEALNANNEAGE